MIYCFLRLLCIAAYIVNMPIYAMTSSFKSDSHIIEMFLPNRTALLSGGAKPVRPPVVELDLVAVGSTPLQCPPDFDPLFHVDECH